MDVARAPEAWKFRLFWNLGFFHKTSESDFVPSRGPPRLPSLKNGCSFFLTFPNLRHLWFKWVCSEEKFNPNMNKMGSVIRDTSNLWQTHYYLPVPNPWFSHDNPWFIQETNVSKEPLFPKPRRNHDSPVTTPVFVGLNHLELIKHRLGLRPSTTSWPLSDKPSKLRSKCVKSKVNFKHLVSVSKNSGMFPILRIWRVLLTRVLIYVIID